MSLYLDLRSRLLAVLSELYGLADDQLGNVVLEQPRDASHGDLSSNAAMVLTKQLGKPPRVIAEEVAEVVRGWAETEEVSLAGPGFINLFLKPEAVLADVMAIDEDGQHATQGARLGQGTPTIVEYVSINPTGPIHVGHGRNAVFGDSIANLLEKAGHTVHREYLMNDAGGQIRVLVKSLHARYLQAFGQDVTVPEDGYPGDYLIEIAEDLKAKDGDKWLAVSDEEELLKGLRHFAVEACMNLIRRDLAVMGIVFDRYFSEYEMHQSSSIMAEAVAVLRAKGLVYEGTLPPPKGKEVKDYTSVELTLFKATEMGLGEDQPIYKRNGEPTYFGQDIGYHWDKWQRGFKEMVTVIGADQAGSFVPLGKALEALTGEKNVYRPVAYEMVKVLRNGEPVRMSKRAGNFVLLKDVLGEVGKDVFRFMMLTVKPTTPLTFDLAKAVEKTMDNPVFYVQYAHARMASVARLAAEQGVVAGEVMHPDSVGESGVALAKVLMMYPQVLEQAVSLLEPHRLVTYLREIAAAIHRWYADVKLIDAGDKAATAERLLLGQRAQWVLRDLLGVCGVAAPDSM